MELSPSDRKRIEHQFDRFCKLILVCEMKDYKKMIVRKMAKEILFSELVQVYGYDLGKRKEIGNILNLGQSTINYHKNSNLKKMRKFMEEQRSGKKETK